MSEEFQKTAANTAVSSNGFTVQWLPAGGVIYKDSLGQVRIDSELLVDPCRILLYPKSANLRGIPESRAREILANAKRVLEHMGHKVETWDAATWND